MVNRVSAYIILATSSSCLSEMAFITSVRAKSSHSLIGLTLEVKSPSLISTRDSSLSSLDGHVVLTFDGLSVEDEERDCLVGLPVVQIMFDMRLDAG